MSTPRIRRSPPTSVLANLPPEQLVQFTFWLVNNETYASAQAKLKAQFGVSISTHTISQFWKKYVAPEINEREAFIRRTVRQQVRERFSAETSEEKGKAQA